MTKLILLLGIVVHIVIFANADLLTEAVRRGDRRVIKTLVADVGIGINRPGLDNPILVAVTEKKKVPFIQFLEKLGAHVGSVVGINLIEIALVDNDSKLVSYLIKRCDIKVIIEALNSAIWAEDRDRILKLLAYYKSEERIVREKMVNAIEEAFSTAIDKDGLRGLTTPAVELFIKEVGAEVVNNFHYDHDDKTPLMLAAIRGYGGVIKTLLSNGADINEQDDEGFTAVMHAAENGQIHCVDCLIEMGANVSLASESTEGTTTLSNLIDENCMFPAKSVARRVKGIVRPRLSDSESSSSFDIDSSLLSSDSSELPSKRQKK